MTDRLLSGGADVLLEEALGIGPREADELRAHVSALIDPIAAEERAKSTSNSENIIPPPAANPPVLPISAGLPPRHLPGAPAAAAVPKNDPSEDHQRSQSRLKLGSLLRASCSSLRGSRTSILRSSYASMGTSTVRGSRLSSLRGSNTSTSLNPSTEPGTHGTGEVIRTVEITDGPLGVAIENDKRGFITVRLILACCR
jgi:hypothetical protein